MDMLQIGALVLPGWLKRLEEVVEEVLFAFSSGHKRSYNNVKMPPIITFLHMERPQL